MSRSSRLGERDDVVYAATKKEKIKRRSFILFDFISDYSFGLRCIYTSVSSVCKP